MKPGKRNGTRPFVDADSIRTADAGRDLDALSGAIDCGEFFFCYQLGHCASLMSDLGSTLTPARRTVWIAPLAKVKALGFELNDGWHITHSITLSARSRSACGIARPRALAVFVLIQSSNAVGCSTGSSLGFAPLRILST
jgi:hypothetical protein